MCSDQVNAGTGSGGYVTCGRTWDMDEPGSIRACMASHMLTRYSNNSVVRGLVHLKTAHLLSRDGLNEMGPDRDISMRSAFDTVL